MSLLIKIGLIAAGVLGLCLASTAERELERRITRADCTSGGHLSIEFDVGARLLCQLECVGDGEAR